jgi:hypothetical protein
LSLGFDSCSQGFGMDERVEDEKINVDAIDESFEG